MLRQFSQETGGRAFFPNQLADLNGVYGQIADELSSQYIVGYTSRNPKRDGAWRRIVVRVNRPNVAAVSNKLHVVLSGWDSYIGDLHNWYADA